MRFTEHEMIFFNSITKGNEVFGIPLKFRPQESHEEEVGKTIQGLIKKGVLESETKLTKAGMLPARALECYKESRTHIIINYLHIALLEKKEAVVIIPLKNREYEMLLLPRVAVLYLLLEKYPILRNGAAPEKEKPQVEDIDTFLRELKECKEHIMVGEFQKKTLVREWVYFWKEDRIYEYDLNRQLKKGADAVQIRKKLLRLLKISKEAENYG